MKIIKFLFVSAFLTNLLTSCGKPGLKITEDEEIKFVQRESKVIKGSDGDIEIYVGDVTMGRSQIKVKSLADNKIYLDMDVSSGDEGYFKYGEKLYYRIKVAKFENHLLHDDLAFLTIRKVNEEIGKKNASPIQSNNKELLNPDEPRTVFEKINSSNLKFIRNGEVLEDALMAAHLESKFLLNKKDIITREDFYKRIMTKSMTSNENYKVIIRKDTVNLIEWINDK